MTTPIGLLDLVRIAAPCQESWEKMSGDERSRYCSGCDRKVYNLSGMTRFEAEAFLENAEGRLCVRLYRRPNGSVMTEDCPTGSRKLRVRMLRRISTVATTGLALINGVSSLLPQLSASALFDDDDRAGSAVLPVVDAYDETAVLIGCPIFTDQEENLALMGDLEPVQYDGNPVPDTTFAEAGTPDGQAVGDTPFSLPIVPSPCTFEPDREIPILIEDERAVDSAAAQDLSVQEWPELQ